MNMYGKIALKAVELVSESKYESYEAAWINAVKFYSDSQSVQKKGCPRHAFLGLANAGLIKNIPRKSTPHSQYKNAQYAEKAVNLLKQQPCLVEDKKGLWQSVVDEEKRHNGQMDVVLALWNADLIIK